MEIRFCCLKSMVKDRYLSVSWPYDGLEEKLSYKALKHY